MQSFELVRLQGLVRGYVVRRENRFLVLVDIGGRRALAYTDNTGRLKGLLREGTEALCLARGEG